MIVVEAFTGTAVGLGDRFWPVTCETHERFETVLQSWDGFATSLRCRDINGQRFIIRPKKEEVL